MFDGHANVTFYKYSELGRGKFGIVRLVEEKETLKHFAAKCIKTRKRAILDSSSNTENSLVLQTHILDN